MLGDFAPALICDFLNPLGKIPVWVEASADCEEPVRRRLAVFVVGLGESFPAWLERNSPITYDVQQSADMQDAAGDAD